jgi:hypothetical protein
MALTAAQICALARQAAHCPGYVSQSGQLLNVILADLCETYDFDVARGTFTFNFNPGLITPAPLQYPNLINGGGPYSLPADYLRAKPNDVMWFLDGVPYVMIALDQFEFDSSVQQPGLQNFPYWYFVDLSLSPPGLVVYPPPSGSYPVMGRYQRQMPDITMPETSAVVPWFPNTQYLRTRLTGELMTIADDSRAQAMLGDGPAGAQGILNRFLKLANDNENRPKSVQLDRRRFRPNNNALPITKLTGW